MKNIEPGMKVRIVDHPDFINLAMRNHIGEVRTVAHLCSVPGYQHEWVLEGLEVIGNRTISFAEWVLEPIEPPKESKDIQETRENPVSWDDCEWQPGKEEVER